MGKVIKILISVLSSLILCIIILPLAVALLLSLPSVQNFAVHKFTAFAAKKIDINISIDKISVRGYNRLELDGLYLEDLKGDTLLYIPTMSANLNKTGIFKGELMFGGINIDSPKIYLNRRLGEAVNVSELVQHIRQKLGADENRKHKKGGLMLADVAITDADFRFHDERSQQAHGGINFKDMDFKGLNVFSREIDFIGDSVAMELHDLAFTDHSGCGVDLLSTDVFAFRKGAMTFRNMHIVSMGSDLNLPELELRCDSWRAYRNFSDSVTVVSKIRNSRVDMKTLYGFVSALKPGKELVAEDVSLDIDGKVNDFSGELHGATLNEETFVAGDFLVGNLKNKENMTLNVGNVDVRTDMQSAERLYLGLKGESMELDDKLKQQFLQMGKMRLTGHFMKNKTDIDLAANFTGDLGYMSVMGVMSPDENGIENFSASVDMRDWNLGKMLDAGVFGNMTMNSEIKGTVNDRRVVASLDSTVDALGFYDKTYSDISLNAYYAGKNITVDMSSKDAKALMALSGEYNFADSDMPRYDFKLDAKRIMFGRSGIDPDSLSWLSCVVDGSGIGNGLDDMNGRVNVNDAVYVKFADTLHLGSVNVLALNGMNNKSITFGSDFLDARYDSDSGYRESLIGIKSVAYRYFPVLASEKDLKGMSDSLQPKVALSLMVKDADNALKLLLPDMNVAKGTELKVNLLNSPYGELLSLTAPYVDYKEIFLDDLDFSLSESNDTLQMSLKTKDIIASGIDMPLLTVDADVSENRFGLSAGFDNQTDKADARVNLQGELLREQGALYVEVKTDDKLSFLKVNDRQWNISCDRVSYGQSKLMLDEFSVHDGRHEILADGVLSANDTDTLSVLMKDVNLDIMKPFIEKYGYDLAGTINGYADIMALRNGIRMDAEATLDSIKVNQYSVDPLKFESQWNTSSQRVIFTLRNMLSDKILLKSYHRSGDKAFLADIDMKELPMGVFAPLLNGAVKDVEGSADLNLELRNDSGELRVNGDVDINGLGFNVPFTATGYKADNMSLKIKNSLIDMGQVIIYDKFGGNSRMTAKMDMHRLSDIKYEVKLFPDNLQLLNTASNSGESFFGKLSVLGVVDVKGDGQGTNIDAALTTGANSVLNVSTGGNSDFSIADYVTFEPEEGRHSEDTLNSATTRHKEYRQRAGNELRRGGMDVNMNLTVTPDLTFKFLIDPMHDNVLTANGNATLDVNFRPGRDVFTIYGMYELTSGNYNFNIQNLIEKKFTLSSGSSILWTGNPSDATLDISASYRLKTSIASLLGTAASSGKATTNVDCVVNITDKLSSPQFSFDVQLPNADSEYQSIISNNFSTQEMMATQFFYLLAFGSLYSDTNYSENLNIGASTGTSLGFDFLTSQIRNILSAEDMSFNLRYTPKSTVNSDEYGFYFQNDLINDKLVLELEGNYDTGNNPTSSSNRVTGGGTLTYYIDSSGNLVLKGYSRTIDRFDENQGLQENGVGIYFKEDFNNMSDLMKRLKRRFEGRKNKSGK